MHFPEYQGERFKKGMWGRVAHSLWFTLLPETGVLGVVIFLALEVLSLSVYVLTAIRRDSAGVIASTRSDDGLNVPPCSPMKQVSASSPV